jgi:predicted DCC family thiol-disulfide oxidoreductase YuxK
VRFVLAEDIGGTAFRFAPLGGPTFDEEVSAERRATLPDSLVVATGEGQLLTRTAAVLYLARRLGGLWRLLAGLGAFVPRSVADAAYDLVARLRHRLFRKPTDSCPLVPAELRRRFDR